MEKDERENDQVYSPKEAVSIKITTNDEFLPTSAHNISQYIEDLRKVPTNAAIGSPYSEMKEETANLIDLPNKIETIELLVEKEYDEIFHFQLLPGELQKYIFYFFDLKTLCTCSQVCKEWRSYTKDPQIWQILFKKDFNIEIEDKLYKFYFSVSETNASPCFLNFIQTLSQSPKLDCIGDCYSVSKHTGNQLLHTTVLRKHISRSRANYICATMKKRNFDLSTAAGSNAAFYRCISESQAKERLLVDKLTYFYIGYNALLTLCFLLFTLLCGLKFDNFISGSWWLIFFPVWIQFATFPILLYVIFWSLKYPNVYNATGAWGFLVRGDLPCRSFRILGVFSVGLFFIFFLLFALKLENDLLPWGVVFLPLFLFSFLVLIAFALIPCFRKYAPAQTWAYWIGNNRLRFKEDATIFYCFLVPGIVFLFLILLKLDKVINPRWALVFIPLWLFDLLVLVFSVGIFVVFSCYKCRNKTVQKQEYVASVFFMIGVITLCFGQLLIALTLEGVLHTHISLALIPIHIVCILVGTGFTLGAYRGYKNFIIVRERNNFKKGIW